MAEPIAPVGDLAGICGHDGTDWLKVAVDANGYLKVVGGGVAGAIEVTQDTPGDLLVGSHQYDGSSWRKSNLLWGYNKTCQYTGSTTSDGSSPTSVQSGAVPANEVWVVTSCMTYQNEANARLTLIHLVRSAADYTIAINNALATREMLGPQGYLVLKEGDYLRARCYSLASASVLALVFAGYVLDINM